MRSATPVRVDGEVLTQRPSQRKLDEARTKVLAGAEPSPSREAALIVSAAGDAGIDGDGAVDIGEASSR